MSDEELAELLAFVLARRPERVTELMLPAMPPEARAGAAALSNALTALAVAEEPARPSAALRDRVLASFQKRRAHPARKALLVIDMQNDHLEPGKPLEVPRARDVVPALQKRLDQARTEGTPVIYVVDEHESVDDPEYDEWPLHNLAGTEGQKVWPAVAPKPGDRVVKKPSFSAFFQSELDAVLDELLVDTLVLTGCATEVQIMATASDALQRGYAVEVPPDSQAGASPMGEQVAMGTIAALAPFQPARRARLAKIAARVSA